MFTVNEAIERILAQLEPLGVERIPLLNSIGKVLAEDIIADIDNPPFDNSAVDGYAVRSVDITSASPNSPVVLTPLVPVFAGSHGLEEVAHGQCVRTMTGAPLPRGADAMVMVEDTSDTGNGTIEFRSPASKGDYVRFRANDVSTGETVLNSGDRINSSTIAMLAAMGRSTVECFRTAKVVVFSSGDEIVDINVRPEYGKIRDSNRYTLAAMVMNSGANLLSHSTLPDNLQETISQFETAIESGADVIITSGGVSVGDKDFIKPAIETLGALDLWRVSMKPGKPVAFGRIANTWIFGLPGNPVSTQVTFEIFVRPALRRLAGSRNPVRGTIYANLSLDLERTPGRQEYIRCRLTNTGGRYFADPTGPQGSGALKSMVGANGLIVVPAETEKINANELVAVMPLDGFLD